MTVLPAPSCAEGPLSSPGVTTVPAGRSADGGVSPAGGTLPGSCVFAMSSAEDFGALEGAPVPAFLGLRINFTPQLTQRSLLSGVSFPHFGHIMFILPPDRRLHSSIRCCSETLTHPYFLHQHKSLLYKTFETHPRPLSKTDVLKRGVVPLRAVIFVFPLLCGL